MAATLLISVGSGVIAAYAGLSMALGAFIAGLLLAETEYRRAVEAMIDPFRGLLLGVFFFSVGMHIDLGFIWREPLLVAAGFVAMIVAKTRAARAALPPVRRAVGGQRRDRPAAGAGRRIRLHRHRPRRPGRPGRGRRGGGRAGRGVARPWPCCRSIALFARRAGHHAAKEVPCRSGLHRAAARRPRQARHRRRPWPGRPARLRPAGKARHRLHRRRPRRRPGRALARASAGRSTTATPPIRCSCSAAASTRRWA